MFSLAYKNLCSKVSNLCSELSNLCPKVPNLCSKVSNIDYLWFNDFSCKIQNKRHN